MNKQMLITYFTTMFAITNPLGNTGIFVSMTTDLSKKKQRKVALQAAFASFIVLVLVTICGKEILDVFGIQIYAFHMAGGLIILIMGLHMLQSKKESMHSHTGEDEDDSESAKSDSIAVVPMALPLIAGPGAMTSVIIQVSKMPSIEGKLLIIAVNGVLCMIIALFLFFSSYLNRILGDSGVRVVTKVMGMILVAMAIMMIGDGFTSLTVDVLDDLLQDGVVSALKHSH